MFKDTFGGKGHGNIFMVQNSHLEETILGRTEANGYKNLHIAISMCKVNILP